MSSRKRNIVTGIVVLGALSALSWMVLSFSGTAMRLFKPAGTTVFFLCTRVDGLSEGSPVFYNGFEVGKVRAVVRLADNEHFRVEGELQNRPPLPHNLVGQIRTQSMLGTLNQIELVTTNTLAAGTLAEGQEITISYVGSSLFPADLIKHVDEAVVALHTQIDNIGKEQLIKHVDEAVVALRTQIDSMGKVIESTQKIIDNPKLRDDLAASMENIRKMTANADGAVTDMREALKKTNKNIDAVSVKIADNLDTLGQAFKEIQEITKKINDGKGTAGALVNDPKLYDEMAMTAKELNTVARSLDRLVEQIEKEGFSIKTK